MHPFSLISNLFSQEAFLIFARMSKAKKDPNDTPLMQQHKAIKQKYPDAILLFRVGDFYETFGQDAIIASQVLGITLTKRNNGAAASLELAGFPHHALDTYLHKLVKAGYRVAICDQLEDPKQAKGIVKRGVTEMITPGTAINDKLLEHHSNNFLASVHFADDNMGVAFLDLSTGEFLVSDGDKEYIDKLLQSFKPSEVIFQRNQQKKYKEWFGANTYTYTLDEWIFDTQYTIDILLKHFETHSLKGFGVEHFPLGLIAAGAIIHYLKDTDHPHLQHITSLHPIDKFEFLWMDQFTVRNLELIHSQIPDGNTLLKVLDNTGSPMGARLIKRWLLFPLIDINNIQKRLDAVATLILDTDTRYQSISAIKLCGDIERLVAKIPSKKINPREVLQIAKGLTQVNVIKDICLLQSNNYIKQLGDALNSCSIIHQKILSEIIENPPATANKGAFIHNGIHAELDELRNISKSGKDYLTLLQNKETEATGIVSLKIGFNNVFGYFLEVNNSQKNKVPNNWIRKQTLTNAERYITPELKEYEDKILGAEDKILVLEQQIYDALITDLFDYLQPLQTNGNIIAILDCLCCFAHNAIHYNYAKPSLHIGFDYDIKEGRHPVIEQNLPIGESYIHNDLFLDNASQQIIILTGPNMSGKSALLRQAALITLMAHMGSFVPASAAKIALTDKIFTRVGASDNLSGGESTFMVEMNETALIINNITSRSLVILDEIGRGTSTYDGISIAWSIAEFLHNAKEQPKTLFATHYHELNELEDKLSRIKNYHITNKEVGNKIIFLRKLARGGTKHSFGIHVAKIAGMPSTLIKRANEILSQLETQHVENEQKTVSGKLKSISTIPELQLSIFDVHSQTFEEVRDLLNAVDINRLTPVEALLKLQEIKNKIK